MRYIVVQSVTEEDGTPDEPCEATSVEGVLPCETMKDVEAALQDTTCRGPWDWAIFELVGGKFKRVCARFEPDGKTLSSLE